MIHEVQSVDEGVRDEKGATKDVVSWTWWLASALMIIEDLSFMT